MEIQKEKIELFRPTEQQERVLEHLGRHELLTINNLVYLLYGPLKNNQLKIAQVSVGRTCRHLKRKGFISCNWYRPEHFKGRGKYPLAYWLVEKGASWVKDRYPATDPKYHGETRSELNIIHDLKRSETRIAIYEFCEKYQFAIGWKKTNLFHDIKPDDLFEITKTKTSHFFLEEEVHKKSFEELYEKLKPYTDFYASESCRRHFGFKYFSVIVPMRDDRAAQNLRTHLRGSCNCLDAKLQRLHLKHQFSLDSKPFIVTTHEAMQSPSFLLDFIR